MIRQTGLINMTKKHIIRAAQLTWNTFHLVLSPLCLLIYFFFARSPHKKCTPGNRDVIFQVDPSRNQRLDAT